MARLRLLGSADDYRHRVEEGSAQLHVFGGGFAITEIKDYTHPTERILVVMLLGGNKFDEWREAAHEKLKEVARVNGCKAIEFACRLGLEKKIASLGYRRKRVLMRLELDEQKILEDSRLRAAA